MLFTVGHFSNSSFVTSQYFYRSNWFIIVNIFIKSLILEVVLDLSLYLLLVVFFLCAQVGHLSPTLVASILFQAQVPQSNLAYVVTSGELVDVWEVAEALNIVVDEPRRMLRSISDILLALLVTSYFFVATTRTTLHRTILIGYIVRVTNLKFVIE